MLGIIANRAPHSPGASLSKKSLSVPGQGPDAGTRIGNAILDFVAAPPVSRLEKSDDPEVAARAKANAAAAAAALAAGALSLPPGPAGWLTILPEMVGVWRIQAQLVADIAALYGHRATLTEEQMIYCLFKHTAAQAVRDLVVRAGERALVQKVTLKALQAIAKRIGVKVTQQAIGKGLARWLPLVGAVGVGAYAYYDTAQVAATAIGLFKGEVQLAQPPGDA
jgi:hypothetical protein